MAKQCNIGRPIKSIRLVKYGHRETIGDLDSSYQGGVGREYHDLVRNIRDGASEQRCGGGVRIIRKRTPE